MFKKLWEVIQAMVTVYVGVSMLLFLTLLLIKSTLWMAHLLGL